MVTESVRSVDEARLLVVDCDAVTRETLKLIFELEGYDVQACGSGEEGMTIAVERQPDIVIAAMILGGLNGLDMAKRVVALYPGCRVILIAAQVSFTLEDEARSLGFDFYNKPVHPTILIDRARVLSAS